MKSCHAIPSEKRAFEGCWCLSTDLRSPSNKCSFSKESDSSSFSWNQQFSFSFLLIDCNQLNKEEMKRKRNCIQEKIQDSFNKNLNENDLVGQRIKKELKIKTDHMIIFYLFFIKEKILNHFPSPIIKNK